MHVTIEKQIKSLYQTATRAVAGVEATRNTYYTTETAEYIAAEFQNPDKYTPLHTVTTYCLHYQQASERGRKEGSKEGGSSLVALKTASKCWQSVRKR